MGIKASHIGWIKWWKKLLTCSITHLLLVGRESRMLLVCGLESSIWNSICMLIVIRNWWCKTFKTVLRSFCQKYLFSSAEKCVWLQTLQHWRSAALYIWNLDTGHQHPAGSKISGSCCPSPSSWKFNPVVTYNVTIDQELECKSIHCFHVRKHLWPNHGIYIYTLMPLSRIPATMRTQKSFDVSLCTNLDSQSNSVGHLGSTGWMERLPKILCNTTSKDAGKRLLWNYFDNVFSVMV